MQNKERRMRPTKLLYGSLPKSTLRRTIRQSCSVSTPACGTLELCQHMERTSEYHTAKFYLTLSPFNWLTTAIQNSMFPELPTAAHALSPWCHGHSLWIRLQHLSLSNVAPEMALSLQGPLSNLTFQKDCAILCIKLSEKTKNVSLTF